MSPSFPAGDCRRLVCRPSSRLAHRRRPSSPSSSQLTPSVSPTRRRSATVYPTVTRSSHVTIESHNSGWFPIVLHHIFDLAAPTKPAPPAPAAGPGPTHVNGSFKIQHGKMVILMGVEGSGDPEERVTVEMAAEQGTINVEVVRPCPSPLPSPPRLSSPCLRSPQLPRTPTAPRLSLSLTGGWTNFHLLLPPDLHGPVHLPTDCHSVHLTSALARRWHSRRLPQPDPRPMYFCDVMGFVGDQAGWDPEEREAQAGFDAVTLETHHGRVVLGLSGDELGGGGTKELVEVYVHETWLQEDGGD